MSTQVQEENWAYQVALKLDRQNELLRRMAHAQETEAATLLSVPVGAQRRIVELDEWLPGVTRTVAPDRSHGNDILALVSATPQDVVMSEPGRIGGQIVNSGASPVILYLAVASGIQSSAAGRAGLWLAASGGAWDFRLGNALWCGPVCAVAQGGNSSLSVAIV